MEYVASAHGFGCTLQGNTQPPGLLGIHTNMPATVPANISKALARGEPPPADLSPDERNA
jgi:hypothetical protein